MTGSAAPALGRTRTHEWNTIFAPIIPLGEVVVRATIMYLFLFFAIRFLLKREGGAVNIADILVAVAIVDGAQPAFSGDAHPSSRVRCPC